MKKRDAIKLHNRDQVMVKNYTGPEKWVPGTIIGEPQEGNGLVIVQVITKTNGLQKLDHTEIK